MCGVVRGNEYTSRWGLLHPSPLAAPFRPAASAEGFIVSTKTVAVRLPETFIVPLFLSVESLRETIAVQCLSAILILSSGLTRRSTVCSY